jgi:hypothetical protein
MSFGAKPDILAFIPHNFILDNFGCQPQLSRIKVSQSMITKAQRDHKASTMTKPKPDHSQPNHLI